MARSIKSDSHSPQMWTMTLALPLGALAGMALTRWAMTKVRRNRASNRVAYVREAVIRHRIADIAFSTQGVEFIFRDLKLFADTESQLALATGITSSGCPTPSTTTPTTDCAPSLQHVQKGHSVLFIPLNMVPDNDGLDKTSNINQYINNSNASHAERIQLHPALACSGALLDLSQQHRSRSLPLVDQLYTSYTELYQSQVGSLSVLADAWNIIVGAIHHCLVAAAHVDAKALSEGGTGELATSSDNVLAAAQVLLQRYNILNDSRLSTARCRILEGTGLLEFSTTLVDDTPTSTSTVIVIVPLDEDLMRRISALVDRRIGLWHGASQMRALIAKTCNTSKLALLCTVVVGFTCLRITGFAGTEFVGESEVKDLLARVVAQRHIQPAGDQHDWKFAVLRIASVNALDTIVRLLRHSSWSIAMGVVVAVAERALINHMVCSVEAEVIMRLSIQDMNFITGTRIKDVLMSLDELRTLPTRVMSVIEKHVSGVTALRHGIAFPFAMVTYVFTQKVQALVSDANDSSRVDDGMLRQYYDPKRVNALPQASSDTVDGNGKGHCLLEWKEGGENSAFASVEASLMHAVIEEHCGDATGARDDGDDSTSNLASSSAISGPLLKSVLIKFKVDPDRPHYALSLMLHVGTCSTLGTALPTPWLTISSVVCFPLHQTSIDTLAVVLAGCDSTEVGESSVEVGRLRVLHSTMLEELSARTKKLSTTKPTHSTPHFSTIATNVDAVASANRIVKVSNNIPIPSLSLKLLDDRHLMETLRIHGMELDVVKACALSEVYSTGTMQTASMKSLLGLHWILSAVSSMEDFILRLAAMRRNKADLTEKELRDIKRATEFVEGLCGQPKTYLQLNILSRHEKVTGLEEYYRQNNLQRRSLARSELAKCMGPFGILNNTLSAQRQTVDQPMHNAGHITPEEGGSNRFSVEFRNVSKSFGNRHVLRDVSFFVAPGEFLGIVGVSGAGKTTILNLLLRIFEPDSGCIFINGIPISTLPARMLRRRIAYVCQDFKENGFFNRETIEENLCLGDIFRDDVTKCVDVALDLADARDIVNAKPLRKRTLPNSRLFSGGEMQRLVVARAHMRERSRLGLTVLDEATSALDGATEQIVMRNLRHVGSASPPTCIAVAHRLATLTEATKIVVLHEGRIIEAGSWAELSQKEGSMFQNLLQLQLVRGEDDPSEQQSKRSMGKTAQRVNSDHSQHSQHNQSDAQDVRRTDNLIQVCNALQEILDDPEASTELKDKAGKVLNQFKPCAA